MLLTLLLTATLAQEPLLAPLTTGEVHVDVTAGLTGRILLDGIDTGIDAPAILTGVAPGEHRIQVRGECMLGMAFVTVEAGHVSRTSVDLQTTGGFLEVSVVPATATVLLDGLPIGTGPSVGQEVACGPHRVEVQAESYPARAQEVVVEMGTAQSLRVDLTVEPDPDPDPEPPPRGRGVRRGVAIGLGVLGAGAIGVGAYVHRLAHQDYRNYYLPAFEACDDVACQEELQDYRSQTIARRYYGGMIVAAAGFAGLTTAGIVGFTSDGVPVLGVTRRF